LKRLTTEASHVEFNEKNLWGSLKPMTDNLELASATNFVSKPAAFEVGSSSGGKHFRQKAATAP
jgi:hypothetical protein